LLVKKAVITAAARSQRTLPLQTLIDVEGNKKSLLCILIDQSLGAGAEEIAVVVWPGDESSYAQAAGPHASRRSGFIPQTESRGYGHAIHCASSFTKGDPFLHMVGDHLISALEFLPRSVWWTLPRKEHCSVSGVQPTRESLLQLLRRHRRTPRSAA
jgi:UTP--glucose-1-phosphate uridylyltransferase